MAFEFLFAVKLFHNKILIKFLFNDIDEYNEKKTLYNTYCKYLQFL